MAKKKEEKVIKDNIVPIDFHQQTMQDMARYSLYVLYHRFVPDIRDGLKPVQRRIIYTMYNDVKCRTLNTKRKSSVTVGRCMLYHPHGDSSIYTAMKPMTNWFEIKLPLINYDSNSGSIQGAPQSSARYTESYLSEFSNECVIGELSECKQVVDWDNTYDNKNVEPQCLPVKVPLLLINGTYAIAIGRLVDIPKHSVNDVIDATIALMHDPNYNVVLVPDPCEPCEIVDTDWAKISATGAGTYTCRGIVKVIRMVNCDALSILSTPDLVWSDRVLETVDKMIKDNKLPQIQKIEDHSTANQLDIRLILKPGSDPEYVKQLLYKSTQLQVTKSVNMEVIDGLEVRRVSYKEYLLRFIDFRRNVKFRLYNARLQKVETRLHELDTYIKVLESGDIENIIHQIRSKSTTEEDKLIDWLMKKLDISNIQAALIIRTPIGKLSKGNLGKYKAEQKQLQGLSNQYIEYITNPNLIMQEIEQELLAYKAKYGRPRQSIIISEAQASNIIPGEFKVILTENNFIRKVQPNDPVKAYKGDDIKSVLIADNAKDLLLFDRIGRVFRLPVSKIPLDQNSNGMDIRLLIKKLTSDICTMMYVPMLEYYANTNIKYFICICTVGGLIKRIDLNDVINAARSGLLYTKINQGDAVCSIRIINDQDTVVVFGGSKAIRLPLAKIPYLKRSTLGSSIGAKEAVRGMSVITNDVYLMVITTNGSFNKIVSDALPICVKNKTWSKVIKLPKTDSIQSILGCNDNDVINVTTADGVISVPVKDVPLASSVATGAKMINGIVYKTTITKSN